MTFCLETMREIEGERGGGVEIRERERERTREEKESLNPQGTIFFVKGYVLVEEYLTKCKSAERLWAHKSKWKAFGKWGRIFGAMNFEW